MTSQLNTIALSKSLETMSDVSSNKSAEKKEKPKKKEKKSKVDDNI